MNDHVAEPFRSVLNHFETAQPMSRTNEWLPTCYGCGHQPHLAGACPVITAFTHKPCACPLASATAKEEAA